MEEKSTAESPGTLSIQRDFVWIVAALCVVVLAHLGVSFWHRWNYPFDLEWMEGGMLVHVDRLRSGEGLYVPPSADFIPYIYPPLYPWVLSLFGDPTYVSGRVLSIVGTFLAMGAAVFALRQEKLGWPYALAPVALYGSCYEDSGAFFDLVRGDAFALALATWSMVLVRRAGTWSLRIGAVLLALSFVAKHNYAALGLPMAIWLFFFRSRRQLLEFLGISVGLGLGWTVYMNVSTDGLFLTYLLEVPSVHPLVGRRFFPGSQKEMIGAMPMLFFVALGVGLVLLFRRRLDRDSCVYWGGIGLVTFAFCALMRAHHGGFLNVLMPGYWMLAVLGAMVLGALARVGQPLLAVLLLVFAVGMDVNDGLWPKHKYTPTQADRDAGHALVERIRGYEGEVLMPHAPWYPVLAGKKASLPLISLWDIDHGRGPLKEGAQAFRDAVEAQRWEAIITAGRSMRYGISTNYESAGPSGVPRGLLRTKSGWPVSPNRILERRERPTETSE